MDQPRLTINMFKNNDNHDGSKAASTQISCVDEWKKTVVGWIYRVQSWIIQTKVFQYQTKKKSVQISKSERNSSSDTDSSTLLPTAPRITDPSPIHLTVDTDTDDFSNAEQFSLLSFEKSLKGNNSLSLSESTGNLSNQSSDGRPTSDGRRRRQNRRSHRRLNSLDSGNALQLDTTASPEATGIGTKSCLAIPKVLRRQRVLVADVASVGNAIDTLVSVVETNSGNRRGRITGRELHETAKAAMNEGDYQEALQMFEAILRVQLDRFGSEKHSSVGAALYNVGLARLRIGEPLKAEEAFLRALAIRMNVLEPDQLDLAATLAKLGSARTTLGKFDEGLHDLREALKISRRVLGRNSRSVAQILCHIACLYFETGELFSAQSTFEDALEIHRCVFQIEPDRDACMAQLTETLCNIGSIQNKRKNCSGAVESFREALYLQRGILGHDHPKVIATLDNLAYSFSKSKLYNQALICYKEMLSAEISHYGSFTGECCDTLAKQIVIYGKLKKVDDAVEVVTKYLGSIQSKSDQDGDWKNPVAEELMKMLSDLKSAKKKALKPKCRPRERSLDCMDRILFDRGKDKRAEV
eukprot:jgi/Psemu1/70346/estExt_Genemark1.C_18540008